MQFGLCGSAQAKRGGPNDDSGAGFREFVARNVEAEALGYHSSPSGLPTLRRFAEDGMPDFAG